jgi:hypothetical protein
MLLENLGNQAALLRMLEKVPRDTTTLEGFGNAA